MRIVQIINHAGLDRGGAERLARGLHEDLLAMGQDARLIALEVCDLGGLQGARSLGFINPRNPRAPLALARALRAALRPGDMVHAHLFPSTFYVSALRQAGVLSGPCVMTEHSTWNRRRGRTVWRALDRFIGHGMDRVVAISAATETELLRFYPTLKGKTAVIRNGVPLRFAAPPVRNRASRVPLILSVGRLVPAKNIDSVLLALKQLTDRPWRYEIVGHGPEYTKLATQASTLGLKERVHFVGHQSDVTGWLARADLFVMPSHYEGFGMAAVEAMNAGLPLVASDVPGLREVVAPTGAPLVPPEDPAALARAIGKLLDDPSLCAALGMRGHEAARTYGRTRMAREYLSMWQSLNKAGREKKA